MVGGEFVEVEQFGFSLFEAAQVGEDGFGWVPRGLGGCQVRLGAELVDDGGDDKFEGAVVHDEGVPALF